MNFVTGLPILANWKGDSYNSMLVIIDQLIKLVQYELVKITIHAPGQAEVIINMAVYYYVVLKSIVMVEACYSHLNFAPCCALFQGPKNLFIAFHPQKNGQTERQNSIIEV